MKRPAWQHYPKDWRNNAKLRLCSWGARGVWLEVLGLMHDNADEYGIIRAPLKDIANAVGCPPAFVRELADKRVMKGNDVKLVEPFVFTPFHAGKRGDPIVLVPAQKGPIWFSSRMVRDEYLRQVRGRHTRFGEPPEDSPNQAPNATPIPPNGDAFGGQSGYGAAFAFASAVDTPVVDVALETSEPSPPRPNGRQVKGTAPPAGWRRNAEAAYRYAQALGVKSLPGESTEALVAKIDEHVKGTRTGARH